MSIPNSQFYFMKELIVLIISYTYEHGHMPKKMYTHMLTSTVLTEQSLPQIYICPEPQNVPLFGNRVLQILFVKFRKGHTRLDWVLVQ